MKKTLSILLATIATALITAAPLSTQSGHISFFSSTPAEDISSNNYSVTSMIDPDSGKLAFSVPMQAFEFEKALMQKHFNSPKFLDTKSHPRATFSGNIQSLNSLDLSKTGTHEVTVKGTLVIKGVSKEIEQVGTVSVSDSGIEATSKFDLSLADFGITFESGKPAKNIAKSIEVTVSSKF